MLQVMMIGRVLVRADNLVQGSDQQGCSPSATPTMITGQVPTVHVPPDHANGRVAVAVPARGGGEDHRDPDPAPSARRPAAEAPPPETELGGSCTDRDLAQGATESTASALRLLVTPDTIVR